MFVILFAYLTGSKAILLIVEVYNDIKYAQLASSVWYEAAVMLGTERNEERLSGIRPLATRVILLTYLTGLEVILAPVEVHNDIKHLQIASSMWLGAALMLDTKRKERKLR